MNLPQTGGTYWLLDSVTGWRQASPSSSTPGGVGPVGDEGNLELQLLPGLVDPTVLDDLGKLHRRIAVLNCARD